MGARFSSHVDECASCGATYTSAGPCDTCTGYGNQEIAECRFCACTLLPGDGKLFERVTLDATGRPSTVNYYWTCKNFASCWKAGKA